MEQNRKIGDVLIDLGYLDQDKLDEGLRLQKETNERLGDILLAKGYIQPQDLTRALAEQFDMEIVDLDSLDIPRRIIEMVPVDLAREHQIIPVDYDEDDGLAVAMGDPLDLYTLDNLRFIVNCPITPSLASKQAIEDALNRYYGEGQSVDDELSQSLQELTSTQSMQVITEEEDRETDASADDAPVIKMVTSIITEAVKSRASDIHVEPMSDNLRIRYRVDGDCYHVAKLPKNMQAAVLARLKIMAKMNMAEKRRPQDGRIKLVVLGRDIDLRVNALPCTHGESVVMRILDKEAVMYGLDQLGFHADDYRIFQGLIKRPNGIILVTGPTGSGKTTTLYAALNELNKPDRKIITAEDPVEYNLVGINQAEVNRAAGMTFEKIIRAMLRQAPNIVLVGEIRDGETAQTAIQAALTGHLVFSTLHTNDAPSAITRLIDMGVAPFLAASSIQAIIAQRLIRKICNDCKTVMPPDVPALKAAGLTEEQINNNKFWGGSGCDSCNGQGFRGRKAIYEIMTMTTRLRDMTFQVETTDNLRRQAVNEGMNTLLMDGIRKILEGTSTVGEVLAVAKRVD